MSAVWYRFRGEARRRWTAWLALALVVGLAGGTVLASVAGAERTRSAYDRFLVAQDAFDVTLVSGIEGVFDIAELDLEVIAALPQVAEAAPYVAMGVDVRTPGGATITPDAVNFAASPGDRFGGVMNRRKLLEGRDADPARPDEVVVGFDAADEFSLVLGDVLEAHYLSNEEAAALFGGDGDTSLLPLEESEPPEQLRVVGIVAVPGEFPPATDVGQVVSSIFLTPAALAAHPDNFNVEVLAVTLHGGPAAVPAFLAEVEALAPGGAPVFSISQQDVTRQVQGALDSLAGALTLSAALAGVVVTLLVGQSLARQASVEAGDETALRALGLTLAQMGGLRLLKAGTIAALGTLGSMVIALALSPVFPIGLAAVAEPDPGVDLDPLVLGLGAPAVLVATVALVAGAAWRAYRAARRMGPAPSPRPSRLAGALAGLGAPPSAVAGAHLAVDPGGRGTRLTSRSSVATIALGVATVVGTVTFVASLDRLVATPPLYGWTWDEVIGSAFNDNFDDDGVSFLGDDPELASVSVGNAVELTIDGTRVNVTGMDVVKGAIQPALVAGEPPVAADELVLAPDVLEGTGIGELVTVALAGRQARYVLVGRAILPLEAGFTTLEGLRRVAPDLQPQLALVNYAVDADRPALRDRAADTLSLDEEDFFPASLPVDLVNFGGADAAPSVVAALMAVVATATLVHTLAVATTRRRHDLGVLRVLGFTRPQALATVAWQATVLVVTALALAVPVGIAAGRVAWLGFASQLGVVPSPVVPAPATLAVVVAALAVAQLAAAAPAWRAARTSPTTALRAE